MRILEGNGITKWYGKGKNKNDEISVTALHSINIAIDKEEIVAIMGPSGSGKSTLLRILGILDLPDEGELNIDGIKITKQDDDNNLTDELICQYRREKIGFVFQEFNLIPILTLRENIELPIRISGKKVDKNYIDGLLETFDLSNRAKHFPKNVSRGQQQRAAIARAMSNKPSIILADEPTGNLDHKNSQNVMEYFVESAALFNQTIIVVTHDPMVASHANRIIHLFDGKIVSK